MSNQPASTPVQPSERLDFIDIIRGFAVFGILMVNMVSFSGRSLALGTYPAGWDRWAFLFVEFFGRAKFYSLFSFLFGWGMAIILIRSEARGGSFVRLYVRRLLFLLLIGIIHGVFIWRGDILTTYALLGFLLIPFRNRSGRFILVSSLFFLALALFMAYPSQIVTAFRGWWSSLSDFYNPGLPDTLYATGGYAEITRLRLDEFLGTQSALPFYLGNIFAMFLWGLYAGKARIFEQLDHHWSLIRRVFWVSLAAGLIANLAFTAVLFWFAGPWPDGLPQRLDGFLYTATRSLAAPAVMLVYLSGILLLLRYPYWQQKLAPLGSVGRTALSNYIFQSIAGTLIFYSYGLGLYGRLGPMVGLILTVLIFYVQIQLSRWWLERYRYGPLEWLWRSWTYGRWQPLRRGRSVFDFDDEIPPRWYQTTAGRLFLIALLVALLWTGWSWWRGRQAPAGDGGAAQTALELTATLSPTPAVSPTPTLTPSPTPEPTPVVAPAVVAVRRQPSPALRLGSAAALAQAFDADRALLEIEELSSAPYDGRFAGSSGGYAAGDYIAAAFAEAGLRPAGPGGSYFQPFEISTVSLTDTPQLKITAADGTVFDDYTPFVDFAPLVRAYAGSGSGAGSVTWANGCSSQDFAPLDVVDRVVICRYTAGRDNPFQMSREALEQGAAALLLLTGDAADSRPLDFGIPYGESWLPDGLSLPTLFISPRVADDLLQGSGQTAVDLAINYTTFPLGGAAAVQIASAAGAGCVTRPCQGRNVLGVLPGRDPAVADEVVILGAHYDHLGQAPDGTTWHGANDNASGTAALIEIARAWQEQGFVPRRSVLFAAWDAEELGLLGSSAYVQYPQYPLDKTLGAIQLDMVGSGEDTLYVDGTGGLEPLLERIAESLGWPVTLSNIGRSDHTPFLASGVPSNLLIWFDGGDSVPSYHRPSDVPAVIEPEKLAGASRVAMLAAFTLAEVEPALDDLLAQRATAVTQANLDAFLSTAVASRHALETDWFDRLRAAEPLTITLRADNVALLGSSATADVRIDVARAGDGGDPVHATAVLPVQFAREGDAWRWAGPAMATRRGGEDAFTVHYPPALAAAAGDVDAIAAANYAALAQQLGLPGNRPGAIWLYRGADALRADSDLTLPESTLGWVGPGTIRLVASDTITQSARLDQAVAQLLLANAGLTEADAPWLWHGLAAAADPVQEIPFPLLLEEIAEQTVVSDATAHWMQATYLWEQLGPAGVGAFVTQASEAGVPAALQAALGQTPGQFATAAQAFWLDERIAADTAVQALISARQTALEAGDREAFLATVDPRVPGLVAAQAAWFDAAVAADSLTIAAETTAVEPGGSLLVTVSTDADGTPRQAFVRLTPAERGYRWGGPVLEQLDGDPVTVRYPAGAAESALALQQATGPMLAQIDAWLGREAAESITLELLSADELQGIMPPGAATTGSDMATGGPVWLALDAQPALLERLAPALVRQRLMAGGVRDEWLLQATAVHLAPQLGSLQAATAARNALPALRARSQSVALDAWPSPAALDEVLQAAVADSVAYFVARYGENGLKRLLTLAGDGRGLDAAVSAMTGQSLTAFQTAWLDSLQRGHLSTEALAAVDTLDEARLLARVDAIAAPAFRGRQAGSEGATAVADLIAAEFAALGLEPVVPVTGTTSLSYQQPFPIDFVTLQAAPVLTLFDAGEPAVDFPFMQELVLAPDEALGSGSAEGELVWVRDGYEGMDFAGKIVVRRERQPLADEMADALAHNAAGLIVVRDNGTTSEKQILAKPAVPVDINLEQTTIPVVVLVQAGYNRLLDATGQTQATLGAAPPALPLGVSARLAVPYSAPVAMETVNVLGLLPGSDPALRDEVIIVGAHYDHVGDNPDAWLCDGTAVVDPAQADGACEQAPGLLYSGRNDNATGVAALLEIARAWQATGYRPARSVLFAAWGAQEAGTAGSRFYAAHPVLPLESTAAMLQLDGIGGGSGYYLEAQSERAGDGLWVFGVDIAAAQLEKRIQAASPKDQSDDATFREAGIPTLLLTWAGASEANWPNVIADEVAADRLLLAARAALLALMVAGG